MTFCEPIAPITASDIPARNTSVFEIHIYIYVLPFKGTIDPLKGLHTISEGKKIHLKQIQLKKIHSPTRKVAQGFSRRAQGLQDQNGRCELGRAKLRKDFLELRKALRS